LLALGRLAAFALASLAALAVAFVALALPVAAHGYAPAPPSLLEALLTWQLEAYVIVPLAAAALLYHWAVRRVNAAHPNNPVPRRRELFWQLGVLTLLIALASPIATYDTTLFSIHMVQHLLLTLVAAPFLALGAPITLLLRLSSPETRRRLLLPVLHSRPVRVILAPDSGLDHLRRGHVGDPLLADLRRIPRQRPDPRLRARPLPGVGTALLVACRGRRPVSLASSAPGSALSTCSLACPSRRSSASRSCPRRPCSIRTTRRCSAPGGRPPLRTSSWAGGIMWVFGDAAFLIGLILAVAVWLKAEEVEGRRLDATARP